MSGPYTTIILHLSTPTTLTIIVCIRRVLSSHIYWNKIYVTQSNTFKFVEVVSQMYFIFHWNLGKENTYIIVRYYFEIHFLD